MQHLFLQRALRRVLWPDAPAGPVAQVHNNPNLTQQAINTLDVEVRNDISTRIEKAHKIMQRWAGGAQRGCLAAPPGHCSCCWQHSYCSTSIKQ